MRNGIVVLYTMLGKRWVFNEHQKKMPHRERRGTALCHLVVSGKIVCTEKLPSGKIAVANVAAKRSVVAFMVFQLIWNCWGECRGFLFFQLLKWGSKNVLFCKNKKPVAHERCETGFLYLQNLTAQLYFFALEALPLAFFGAALALLAGAVGIRPATESCT